MVNRFSKMFNENMSFNECRTVLFTLAEGLSKDELKELFDAYNPVSDKALARELDYARKNSCLML